MSVSYHLTACFISVILLSGCGGDTTAPVDPVGTYRLTHMNGAAVPTLWAQASDVRIDIVSGSMVLRPDFSYRQTNEFRWTWNDGSVTTSDWTEIGNYSISGRQISFTIDTEDNSFPPPYTGSIDHGVVAYTYNAVSYRFER